MKVLMIGWEFPPFKAGGLGVHCYELTKELGRRSVEIDFYMPALNIEITPPHEKVSIHMVSARPEIGPYKSLNKDFYGAVREYNENVKNHVIDHDFQVIHAHDWITFLSGVELKERTGKPLVVTVHSTEWDRTAGHPYNWIYDIELLGMQAADAVITVSRRMKVNLTKHYGIDPSKIFVVYNGVTPQARITKMDKGLWGKSVVLYLGRLTIQKNPEIFLSSAKRVLERRKDVHFIIAGSGDMMGHLIQQSIEMEISENVTFTGFISDEEASWLYSISDVYVLPAVSEPFGITVLEAMISGAAVIISKDVGVGEVLDHCLKVDFWDAEDIAQNILTLIEHKTFREMLTTGGSTEALRLTWDETAKHTLQVYEHAAGTRLFHEPATKDLMSALDVPAEESAEHREIQNLIRSVRQRKLDRKRSRTQSREPPARPSRKALLASKAGALQGSTAVGTRDGPAGGVRGTADAGKAGHRTSVVDKPAVRARDTMKTTSRSKKTGKSPTPGGSRAKGRETKKVMDKGEEKEKKTRGKDAKKVMDKGEEKGKKTRGKETKKGMNRETRPAKDGTGTRGKGARGTGRKRPTTEE